MGGVFSEGLLVLTTSFAVVIKFAEAAGLPSAVPYILDATHVEQCLCDSEFFDSGDRSIIEIQKHLRGRPKLKGFRLFQSDRKHPKKRLKSSLALGTRGIPARRVGDLGQKMSCVLYTSQIEGALDPKP